MFDSDFLFIPLDLQEVLIFLRATDRKLAHVLSLKEDVGRAGSAKATEETHTFTSLGPKFHLRFGSDWSLILHLPSQLDK